MVGPLVRALVVPPVPPHPSVSWRDFGYRRPIDHALAAAEHRAFRETLASAGVEVVVAEGADPSLQDAVFPADPLLVTDRGAVLGRMAKPLRAREVELAERTVASLGVPVAGRVVGPGTLEGGDCLWLDERTLVVGRGYRTNGEGIRQLGAILASLGVTVVPVDLPHWRGPGECLHLLSLVSLVDEDLAVAYLPLLSVELVRLLEERGVEVVPVPDEEFPTQGPNVLALAPRRCLVLEENRETVRRLEARGCEVLTYSGQEISHNRGGGPTCLVRPLLRLTR
jgi:dimethylargininase